MQTGERIELEKKITLAIRKFAVRSGIEIERLPLMQDYEFDMIVVRLCRKLAALEGQSTLAVPATWWDAVKKHFAPPWFRRRWPIRFVHYQAIEYLPNVPIPANWREKSWVSWDITRDGTKYQEYQVG